MAARGFLKVPIALAATNAGSATYHINSVSVIALLPPRQRLLYRAASDAKIHATRYAVELYCQLNY
jgi:hypothetical protein